MLPQRRFDRRLPLGGHADQAPQEPDRAGQPSAQHRPDSVAEPSSLFPYARQQLLLGFQAGLVRSRLDQGCLKLLLPGLQRSRLLLHFLLPQGQPGSLLSQLLDLYLQLADPPCRRVRLGAELLSPCLGCLDHLVLGLLPFEQRLHLPLDLVLLGGQQDGALGDRGQFALRDIRLVVQVRGAAVGVAQRGPQLCLVLPKLVQTRGDALSLDPQRVQPLTQGIGPLLRRTHCLLCLAPVVPVPGPFEPQQVGRHTLVLPDPAGLFLEAAQPGCDLADDVVHPLQVAAGLVELGQRLLAPSPVDGDARGLLEQESPLLRPQRQGCVDESLPDDGVGALAQAALAQQVDQVAEANPVPVEYVLAFAGAIGTPSDGNLGEVDREPAVAVVQSQQDLGHPGAGTTPSAVEDHIGGGLAAQRAQALLTKGPADRVSDVGLSGPVRPNDRGDAGQEFELRPAGEGLVALQFESSESHRRLAGRRHAARPGRVPRKGS